MTDREDKKIERDHRFEKEDGWPEEEWDEEQLEAFFQEAEEEEIPPPFWQRKKVRKGFALMIAAMMMLNGSRLFAENLLAAGDTIFKKIKGIVTKGRNSNVQRSGGGRPFGQSERNGISCRRRHDSDQRSRGGGRGKGDREFR